MTDFDMKRRLLAEAVGTSFLLMAVVGSGIMAERLAGGNVGIALLTATIPTGAMLVVLIMVFGPISGAHLNPAVTLAMAMRKVTRPSDSVLYVLAQLVGGISGVVAAHLMFELPMLEMSATVRSGGAQFFSEVVATFGLVGVVLATVHLRPSVVPYAVGLYITAAYWFTSSTSFANPAVTVARTLTNTFSGIRSVDAFPFIGAQVIGAVLATALFSWFLNAESVEAKGVDDRP